MTSQHTIGINVPTDEQVSSDQEKSSEGRIEQEKLAESVSMKESHHDFIQRIKELRKTDPFPVNEHLQLSSEEATYLAVQLHGRS